MYFYNFQLDLEKEIEETSNNQMETEINNETQEKSKLLRSLIQIFIIIKFLIEVTLFY